VRSRAGGGTTHAPEVPLVNTQGDAPRHAGKKRRNTSPTYTACGCGVSRSLRGIKVARFIGIITRVVIRSRSLAEFSIGGEEGKSSNDA